MPKPVRIVRPRAPGIPIDDTTSAYARGVRAEDIVGDRVHQYAIDAAAKRAARGTRPPKVRSPNSRLTYLRRALLKRKTLEARARIQTQIDALEHELGIR